MDLNTLKARIDNNEGDYYENIIAYILLLIEEGNKYLAFDYLKAELDQPYVPSEVLEQLEAIFEEHFVVEITTKQISIDEAKAALKQLKIEHLVSNFYTINLRLLTDEITYYLEHTTDYISASFLIYVLIEQGVSLEFVINKFGKQGIFLTSDLEIVDEDLLAKYEELFQLEFAKNPSFVKYCMEILNYYLVVVFPFKMDIDFDLFAEIVGYIKNISSDTTTYSNHPKFLAIVSYDN